MDITRWRTGVLVGPPDYVVGARSLAVALIAPAHGLASPPLGDRWAGRRTAAASPVSVTTAGPPRRRGGRPASRARLARPRTRSSSCRAPAVPRCRRGRRCLGGGGAVSRQVAVWVVVVALAHGERRAAVASSTPARHSRELEDVRTTRHPRTIATNPPPPPACAHIQTGGGRQDGMMAGWRGRRPAAARQPGARRAREAT